MKDGKVVYIGKGFIQGVPARDLSLDEWETLDKDTQKLALESGLYKLADKPKYEPIKGGE